MREPIGEAKQRRDLRKIGLIGLLIACDVSGNINVGLRGQCRKKIELLKNEANFAPAHFRTFGISQARKIAAVDLDPAGIGSRQSAQQVKESGFSAS